MFLNLWPLDREGDVAAWPSNVRRLIVSQCASDQCHCPTSVYRKLPVTLEELYVSGCNARWLVRFLRDCADGGRWGCIIGLHNDLPRLHTLLVHGNVDVEGGNAVTPSPPPVRILPQWIGLRNARVGKRWWMDCTGSAPV